VLGSADPAAVPPPAAEGTGGGLERGRYLTEQVAMCIQCHTPRDEQGALIVGRKFQGAPIPAEELAAGRDWALEAPPIAGMAGYGRDEAVRLLAEGIARDGEPPAPPMPPFRMSEADAAAVYDYLASLPRGP
jgi:mono/diheme cytochrome c family protein